VPLGLSYIIEVPLAFPNVPIAILVMDECGFNRLEIFYFVKDKSDPQLMIIYRKRDALVEVSRANLDLKPKVLMPVPEEMINEGMANGQT
jgi:hypothetical protein